MADEQNHGKVLTEWEFDEFPRYQRTRLWYITGAIIGGALLLYAIISLNYLFAAIIIIIAVIIVMQNRRQPHRLTLRVCEDGLAIGENTFYAWKDIKNFWIIYEPPDVKSIYFAFKTGIRPTINLPLENQNPLNIRKLLLNYLIEDTSQEEESFSDGMRRMMKF